MTLALNCDRPGDGSVSPQRGWRGALKAANCSICANAKGGGDNMGQAEKRAIRQGWHAARPALWKNACARPWTNGAKGGKRSFYRTRHQGMRNKRIIASGTKRNKRRQKRRTACQRPHRERQRRGGGLARKRNSGSSGESARRSRPKNALSSATDLCKKPVALLRTK